MPPDTDGTPKLRRIAERLVKAAMDGESWAICCIADRLDGRAPVETSVNVFAAVEAAELTDAQLVQIIAGGSLDDDAYDAEPRPMIAAT